MYPMEILCLWQLIIKIICLYTLSCTHENLNFCENNLVNTETSRRDLQKSPQTFFVFHFKNLHCVIFLSSPWIQIKLLYLI